MNRRTLILVVCGSLALIAFVVAVAGSMTYWFGLNRPVTNAGQAQDLCEAAVRHDLLAPTNASFRIDDVRRERLFEDDNVALGARAADVTEVWSVVGHVESPAASGALAQSEFRCRTYLFIKIPPKTSVHYGDADIAGQRTLRP